MKNQKLIFGIICLVIGIVITTFYVAQNYNHNVSSEDLKFYTELNLENGTADFQKAKTFLMLSNEIISNHEITFYIYNRNNHKELHAKIIDKYGNCSIFAREMSALFMNISYMGDPPVVHSCQGNPCSSCTFTRRGGKITGCSCAGGWGVNKCDHHILTIDIQ